MLTVGASLYALAMLALVLGLILGLGWFLRTYGTRLGFGGGGMAHATLQVRQRLSLTAQHSLVEVADTTGTKPTRYLIVLGPNHSTVVAQTPLPKQGATR
ncbi:MAG: hypothetical protein INF43_00995 [Alphaproteobacteria bacterium]|nr:hypothetical protein [Alphaproteobacteria bacterium]